MSVTGKGIKEIIRRMALELMSVCWIAEPKPIKPKKESKEEPMKKTSFRVENSIGCF